MPKSSDRLHFNQGQEIAAHVFDDETVIMRLDDGAYFNMNMVGSTVWEMIEVNSSVEEIIAGVLGRFDVPVKQAETDVRRLVKQLIQEKLVVSSRDQNETGMTLEPQESGNKFHYETPFLHAHHDMRDLLALDPPFGTDCKCGKR